MLRSVVIQPGEAEYDRISAFLPAIFPPEELPPADVIEKPLPYLCFYDDDEFIGFAEVLKTPELHYLKYMAMLPQHRSKGYGGKMLDLILSERGGVPLALDVEFPDETAPNYEQRLRRIKFYRNHGLSDTGYVFIYCNLPYVIMSTGEAGVPALMQDFFNADKTYAPGSCRIVKREMLSGLQMNPATLPSGGVLVKSIPLPEWLQLKEKSDLNRIISGDEAKMRYVVEMACENVRQKTGGPFAAAIFDLKSDRLIAAGINVVVPANQSWAHAEMTAFAHAQNRLQSYSLKGCILVTSCEPCAMCSGATPWSGVEKMLYGATKEMAEAAGFDEGYKGENWRFEFEKRQIKVVGPLLGNESNAPFELYGKMQGMIY